MRKRFQRSELNRFLGHEAVSGEVTSSHAYRKVAKNNPSTPRVRRPSPTRAGVVAGYRDSMVGSIAQYRDRLPTPPKAPDTTNNTPTSEGIVGNRPKSGTSEQAKTGVDRRAFTEPTKRNFNPFS